MTSHELARELLKHPDLPVATHANNHTSAGDIVRVGLMYHYSGDHVCIGNMSLTMSLNRPNEYIKEWYVKGQYDQRG